MSRTPTPPMERFRAKYVVTIDGCWEWTAYRNPQGYGQFCVVRGVTKFAHRYAYEQLVGEIPDGMTLDHLCRNRACCNPDHLDPCPQVENWLRSPHVGPNRDRCGRGHLLDRANAYITPQGYRQCRTCNRDWYRRRKGVPSDGRRGPMTPRVQREYRPVSRKHLRGAAAGR